MTPEELAGMSTQQQFDYLRMNTDFALAPVIDALEERWLLEALMVYGPYVKGRRGIHTQMRYEDDGLVKFEIACEHEIDLGEPCAECRENPPESPSREQA